MLFNPWQRLRSPIWSMASRISCARVYSAGPSSDNSCRPCPFAHSVYSISCSGACALPQTEGHSTGPPVSSSQAPGIGIPERIVCLEATGDHARRAVPARTYGCQIKFTRTRGLWPCSGVITLTYPMAIISSRGRSAPPFSPLPRPLVCRYSPATARIVASSADGARAQRGPALSGGDAWNRCPPASTLPGTGIHGLYPHTRARRTQPRPIQPSRV
jgi:hypothetical protein